MDPDINFVWLRRFKLVSAAYVHKDVSVTFQADMSAETAHAEGVYLGGRCVRSGWSPDD